MFAFAVIAAAVAGASQPPAGPIVVEGNRRVCRSIPTTGSILPKTVCKTKDEWSQESAASRALVDQRAREQTTYQQTIIRSRSRPEL